MHQYLRQIFEKVKEENKKELSEKKVKRRMEAR